MKRYIPLFLSVFFYINGLTQDSLLIVDIDQTIKANEVKVSTIYQKIERSRIESMHGKNPSHEFTLFKMTNEDILLSATLGAYSINDTSIIITYFFNNGELTKVSTTSFNDFDNRKSENNYYFNSNELINKDAEAVGPFSATNLTEQAKRILKGLKKKPIKFPT